jgi:tetratricopeptide (TPR) repeat protein
MERTSCVGNFGVNEQEQQLPTQARTALEKCFAQIRLARATELAQSKRFLEAEAVLMLNGELPDNPRELDLLARMAAQQEQFGKARRLWEAALQKSPADEEYVHCLEQVRNMERTTALTDRALNYLVWFVVLFGIAAIVYAFKPLK